MTWRSWVSRVLAGVAMIVGVALIVFVGVPWLMERPAAPQPPGIEEIVAQALAPSMLQDENTQSLEETPEDNGTTEPLVAVGHDGEDMAVVFPSAVGDPPDEGAASPGDDAADESHEVTGEVAGEGLPPALSPEEIAGAMETLEAGPVEGASQSVVAGNPPVAVPDAAENADAVIAQALELVKPQPTESGWAGMMHGEVAQVRDGHGLHVEAPLPPASATREVQELLGSLGYAPGPVDGVWGERTAGAWRRFARDAAERADAAEAAEPQPEGQGMTELDRPKQHRAAGPSVPCAPPPPGGDGDPEGAGAEQAGVTRPRAGLPPRQAPVPVVVPQMPRGVMGYRMPLVSRQGVPDQVVSGVLIPAHTTFVVLKPGHWELLGMSEEEARLLTQALEEPALDEPEGVATLKEEIADRRRFRLFDVFRGKERRGAE